MSDENAANKMARARAGLLQDGIFWGSQALGLALREDPLCETAWTDGKTLGYNPVFINGLRLAQVKGLLAHECMHPGLGHHARRGDRDPKRWNIACDIPINRMLRRAKFELPDGALFGDDLGSPDDLSAEQIYSRLPKGYGDPKSGQGNGQGQTGPTADPGQCGEVRDAPGPNGGKASPAELAAAEVESKVKMSQAGALAKRAGQLTGDIERLVETVMGAKVDWREALRQFVDTNRKDDYSWVRPNARYLAAGYYLPSLYSPALRPIAMGLDFSGSVDNDTLSLYTGEIGAIVEDLGVTITALYCDTQVRKTQEITPDTLPVQLESTGGGGTDYRPVFAEVDSLDLSPSCLIYLTDGECWSFPAQAPPYPVLWAIYGGRKFNPPFGEVIYVD